MQHLHTVCYERLRPAQIVARREACPVAYLPIGTIEWHGGHNPLGLDTLKIHALLMACAEANGGLVFPPLYYGENREQALMEVNAVDRDAIAAEMGLSPSQFDPGHMYEPVATQNTNYHRLLIHVFHEIKSLGFEVLVVGAGHYPLLDHARAAAAIYHQTQTRPRMLTWAMSGYELVRGEFEPCGDHAGKWETSLLMHLDPGMQDMEAIARHPDGRPVGGSDNGVEDSNAAFGQRVTDRIVEVVGERVREMLEHPEHFRGHGSPM